MVQRGYSLIGSVDPRWAGGALCAEAGWELVNVVAHWGSKLQTVESFQVMINSSETFNLCSIIYCLKLYLLVCFIQVNDKKKKNIQVNMNSPEQITCWDSALNYLVPPLPIHILKCQNKLKANQFTPVTRHLVWCRDPELETERKREKGYTQRMKT